MQKCPKRIQCQSDKDNKPDTNGNPSHISMNAACKILFLDNSSVRYYIIRKRIRSFKSAGQWWLNKKDVENLKKWHTT